LQSLGGQVSLERMGAEGPTHCGKRE